MSGEDFTVDSEHLAALIERMSECERTLERLTNDVERSIATVQETWHGEAADAQRMAHAEWEKGLASMREAIEELREQARTAHDNYSAAAQANLEMWQSVR